MDTAQLNKPVSIQNTAAVGWTSSVPVGTASAPLTPVLPHSKESRFLFELKVLGVFLMEILAHPRTTSRVTVDSEGRTVVVERE